MIVIAKMQVRSVEDYGMSRLVKLSCVHDNEINTGANPENRSFTRATPSGEAAMTIDNHNVWDSFHPPLPNAEGHIDWQTAMHYVVFINASKYSLEDVHRALAYLDSSSDKINAG